MTLNHLEGALAWWDAGCSVIPIRADGTKKPFGQWKDYQTFRAPRRKVEQWFKATPNWGVGLICGEVSGGLEMLELEGKAMDSASLDKVNAAMERHDIIDLWTELTENGYAEITPSGGLHILYRIVDHVVPGNTKIANRPPTAEELGASPKLRSVTLAETRGEGGFVIVAPTKGSVHPTGDSWSVTAGEIGAIGEITWADRNTLHAAIYEALDTMPPPPPRIEPARSTLPRSSNPGDLAPGEDFNAKTSWSDLLNQYGWTYHSQYFGSAEELWTRPGKDPHDGHSASVGYQGSDNIYCWSSAADLPIEEPISKFGFYTYMEHRGDFSASARALRAQGFGSKPTQGIDISDWFEAAEPQVAGGSDPAVDTPAGVVAEPVAPQPRLKEWTETGVAHMMLPVYGDRFRMVHEERAFRTYADGVWVPDTRNGIVNAVEQATGYVRQVALQGLEDAKAGEDKEEIADAKKLLTAANSFRSARGINAVTTRFGQQPKVSAEVADFDRAKNLLCLDNGTFDLDTMTLREHSPQDMLTKRIPVSFDAGAQCPGFLKFLEEVLPDPEYRAFVRRALAMTLLGSVREAAFIVMQGLTGCGKSQFMKIAHALMGQYAATAAPGTFRETRGKGGSENYDLHDLRGVRMASMSETSEGDVLNEELLKRVTGGDNVKSRTLFQAFVEWKPEFTVWVATNFLPRLNAGDDAIWRRVKVVKFPNQFKGSDAEIGIAERLIDEELAGIFNWLLEGVADYRAVGLSDPEAMAPALEEYRNDVDPVTQFFAEVLDEGTLLKEADAQIRSSELYRTFKAWSDGAGIKYPMSPNRFGRRVTDLGYDVTRSTGGVKMRKGLKLNPGVWQAEVQGGFPRRQ